MLLWPFLTPRSTRNRSLPTNYASSRATSAASCFPMLPMPQGLSWMLVRLDIHFRTELRWPGVIEMGLGVAKFGRTSVTFDQVVFSQDRCAASAQSVTVLIDEETRKPTPLTEEITRNFQRWIRRGTKGM